MEKQPVFRLEDYSITPYSLPNIELCFQLDPEKTIVKSTLTVNRRDGVSVGTALILDGDELNLISLKINGSSVDEHDYCALPDRFELYSPPAQPSFQLEIITEINPQKNRQLMGLYRSNGTFCTQCEAQGFRRITYFYDRPDILSNFTVRIEADEKLYPVLLSNGNMIDKGKMQGGRHFATWQDPHPKPCYLFALVAGDLASQHDSFTTMSGRKVALGIYVEQGKAERATYAMDALKRAMRWDEDRFGREYDLDLFNIVAVSDFNMGAMENKGLNIFNDKYILADPDTATDDDYANIERVIGHEYFHNWTGDRITCRDWFQLCLKEGLTVYRDQEFSADQRSRAVQRIGDIRVLKAAQFPEDAGPLAHPVRPRRYSEINNFYTATVYEKGAEVVRMIHTILGDALFRQGMDLYFERHDGHACTIEDFVTCFADVSKRDFSQFMLWYEQAGTPYVTAQSNYANGRLTLILEQSIAPTPGQTKKSPMMIPIAFALVDQNGNDMPYKSAQVESRGLLLLTEKSQVFEFTGLNQKPVISLLRNFSSPIALEVTTNDEEIAFLAYHDKDPVNRWQALTRLLTNELVSASSDHEENRDLKRDTVVNIVGHLMSDTSLEPALRSLFLSLPTENEIARIIGRNIDPDAIYLARRSLMLHIATTHASTFETLLNETRPAQYYSAGKLEAGKRALANTALSYLSLTDKNCDRIARCYAQSNNMTNRIAALSILANYFTEDDLTKAALQEFEERYRHDPLVMDKWFTIQAMIPGDNALNRVKYLRTHPLFSLDNPNRTRALIAAFASGNPTGFHRKDGAAYNFLVDIILTVDPHNAQLSSRLLTLLGSWKQLEPIRRAKAEQALKRIEDTPSLSRDLQDIIVRMLK